MYIDRHDPDHVKQVSSAQEGTASNQIWDNWRYGVLHFGFGVNGWWRLVWFVFEMVPLLLAWTGVSTWLYKRGASQRKRRAIAARAAEGLKVDDPDAIRPASPALLRTEQPPA